MNILGFYSKLNLTLVEKDGVCFVVDKSKRKIIAKGSEEECTKLFVMIIAGF
jgi:hypothetical protein